MKKYISAELAIINVKDSVIATSGRYSTTETSVQLGADRFHEDWDAGY